MHADLRCFRVDVESQDRFIWYRKHEAAVTSRLSVVAAFAIILIDLLGRAGLDKVLALTDGPSVVALWAQLQSVVELVSTVALAGVLQGLTVMVAQKREAGDEGSLLRAALKLGLGTSLVIALSVASVASIVADSLAQGRIAPDLFRLAALVGLIAIIPATLNAYWLGKHQQQRMLLLALLTGTTLLLVAMAAWFGLSLRGMMLVQCSAMLMIAIMVWRYLRKRLHARDGREGQILHAQKLARFVPVGVVIGIMTPVSMLLVRGTLSDTLSWTEVGFFQALWRAAEWVTATSAGVLMLIFLPRFSSTLGSARFRSEMLKATVMVLIPAACLLFLIYYNQRSILAFLYDAQFVVSDEAAALFMLGSWVRIASWVFLFGLFAAHRTKLIMIGEVVSLPLYAWLLWLFGDGMTLERAALLYLVSFVVYLGFTAASLLYSSRSLIDLVYKKGL